MHKPHAWGGIHLDLDAAAVDGSRILKAGYCVLQKGVRLPKVIAAVAELAALSQQLHPLLHQRLQPLLLLVVSRACKPQ